MCDQKPQRFFGSPARDVNCPDLHVCDGTAVWDDTTRPYLVVSDVYVCDTGTLQIEAGAVHPKGDSCRGPASELEYRRSQLRFYRNHRSTLEGRLLRCYLRRRFRRVQPPHLRAQLLALLAPE